MRDDVYITTIKAILAHVKYNDWDFHVAHDPNGSMYLQIQFWAMDNDEGVMVRQFCRKWMLSKWMTKSEIVLTAWKAVQSAIEHEAREQFTYKGARIFGPHICVDALAMASNIIDARDRPSPVDVEAKP